MNPWHGELALLKYINKNVSKIMNFFIALTMILLLLNIIRSKYRIINDFGTLLNIKWHRTKLNIKSFITPNFITFLHDHYHLSFFSSLDSDLILK